MNIKEHIKQIRQNDNFNNIPEVKEFVIKSMPEANITIANMCLWFSLVLLITWFVFFIGIYESDKILIILGLIVCPIILTTTSIICKVKQGKGKWIQYVFFILIFICFFLVNLISGYRLNLLLILPVVLSFRYYNRDFTNLMIFLGVLFLLGSTLANAFFYKEVGILDISTVYLPEGLVLTRTHAYFVDDIIALNPDSMIMLMNSLRLNFIPNILILIMLTYISSFVIRKNFNLVFSINRLGEEKTKTTQDLANMKAKVLLTQMQPHFVCNALTSISYLCKANPEKAQDLSKNLSTFLRNNANFLNSDELISFEQEKLNIESYFNIEKARFSDRVNLVLETEVNDFELPSLTLQPLIENAIKHGICKKEEGGTVILKTCQDEDNIYIYVIDDGVGFDISLLQNEDNTHIGLNNAKTRLTNLCNGTFEIESTINIGTKIKISLPKGKDIK